MNPREIYERNPADSNREAQCKLRPHEWDLYLRLDGLRTLQEISAACKLDLQWIVSDIERLQQLELVRIVELDLAEYQQRFIKSREAVPDSPRPTEKPMETAEGKRVSFSLRRGEHAATRTMAPVPPPAVSHPSPPTNPVEEHHLKPFLNFITSRSGGGTVGQLAAYRVFLKVPNDLLRQAGIRSLNLVGDDFTVRDPHLWRTLLNAVEEVLGERYVPSTVPASALAVA